MQYRKDRYGNEISTLGFGCMRFSLKAGKIDLEKATEEIKRAYDLGVNYYDTAYIYPGSEEALGKIFESLNIREKIKIATKLPHYLLKKETDAKRIFEEELSRLKTNYVDYYLMHMLSDISSFERLKELKVLEFLEEEKKSGRIKQVGFSYHGNSDMFTTILNAYDWDFCQIQYNYMDEHSQAGVSGLKAAYEKNIPVIIMEPLRGGRLVKHIPDQAKKLFSEGNESKKEYLNSPASWAFSWLYNQKEVTCVLSGMNSLEMVEENVRIAKEVLPGTLTDDELLTISKVKDILNHAIKVGCTGCRYCMPCPKGVDIPGIFASYNRYYSDSKFEGLKDYVMCTVLRTNTSRLTNCIGCGKCEIHCPQHISIREELKNVGKIMENPALKLVYKVVPHLVKY